MKYSASFTAGGILFNEFEAILPFVVQGENMKIFLDKEIKENVYLRIATESARIRVTTEIKKRLKAGDPTFWNYYQSCTTDERKLLLFYLCVKTYHLVRDYHFKVTVPSFWAYRTVVDAAAYKMYLDELGSKDEEVDSWSETTQRKTITNYIRMLGEAGFLQGDKLQQIRMENSFYCFFLKQNDIWALDIFFLTNNEKQQIREACQ